MDSLEWENLRDLVRSRTDDLRTKVNTDITVAETTLLEKIEEAKNDAVLAELQKLGARIGRIEAKLPDPEPEEED